MSRLRANQITNENANGAPNFPHGLTVTGIVTATTSATSMSQIVVGSAVTANSNGVDTVGIVTAGTFKDKAGGTFAPNPTTTRGDLIIRGVSVNERLAIGSAGQVLKVNSGANGLEYGVGGRILQVVSVSKGDKQSWTGTAETEITNLAPTITPSSASNKILVLGTLYTSSDVASITSFNVVKRSINSGSFTTIGNHIDASDSNSTQAHGHGGTFNGTWNLYNSSINFLDSPNTTNAIVYKWFFRSESSGGTTYVNRTGRNNTVYHPKTISTLTLMEVAV